MNLMNNKSNRIHTYSMLIFEGINGKYPDIGNNEILQEVTKTHGQISKITTLRKLLGKSKKIMTAADDINNQVLALCILEKFIDAPQLTTNPVSFLHKVLYAQNIDITKRKTPYVEDYPGELLNISQIDARFMEFESLVRVLALTPQPTIQVSAYLLSHVYASIIRVHFFKDGNGRAARFTVLYLLKRWGLDFIPIPKVRNDSAWKKALFNAIQGDINPFASILEIRLKESYQNNE